MPAPLSEGENKLFESGGADDSALRLENPDIAPPEPIDPEPKEPAEPKSLADPDKAKAEREARRKAAIEEFGLVDLEALKEARAETKTLKQKQAEFEEWRKNAAPLLEQLKPKAGEMRNPYQPGTEQHQLWEQADPAQKKAAWEWEEQRREVKEILAARQRDDQQRAALRQSQQLMDWAQGQAEVYKKTNPAFDEAFQFAFQARDKEIQSAAPWLDAATRKQMIDNETGQIIIGAYQNQMNPAELAYQYAVSKGFTPKGNVDKTKDAVKKIQEGQKAAGGLNGGGASPKDKLTIEDINRMPTRTPAQRKAYSEAWDRLVSQG